MKEINIIENDIYLKRKKADNFSLNDPDRYINFVNFYNGFINHRQKSFKPIKGEFIL
ncbi:MAG TPA: hypothetical protein PK771_08080 [Spirochaetota bacterium]|nr:hypothetical protein [Spirochaetota bacterium]